MANGHPHARRYPLATVWYEAQLVTERTNRLLSTEITLMHAAMMAVMNSKAGVRNLKTLLGKLDHGN